MVLVALFFLVDVSPRLAQPIELSAMTPLQPAVHSQCPRFLDHALDTIAGALCSFHPLVAKEGHLWRTE